MLRKACRNCGVALGKFHQMECSFEECPACHTQGRECGCCYAILNINIVERANKEFMVGEWKRWLAVCKALGGRIPYGSERGKKLTLAQERRASLGKPLTRSEMFRIYNKCHVVFETIYWPGDADRWRERVGIVHRFSEKRHPRIAGIKTKKSRGTLSLDHFGPPTHCAFTGPIIEA